MNPTNNPDPILERKHNLGQLDKDAETFYVIYTNSQDSLSSKSEPSRHVEEVQS
jgi:hypothetical protein